MSEGALDGASVAALLESVGDDMEFLGELFSAFADEAPGLMQTIEAAVGAGESERLRHAAHTLKSTSASLGALKVSAASQELELSGRSAVSPPPGRVAELRKLVDEALVAMSAMVQRS